QVISDYIDDATLKIVEAFDESKEKANLTPEKQGEKHCEISEEHSGTPVENNADKEVTKAKKSVSFNPNDEKIRKFTAGEPIVDQQNPFKHTNGHLGAGKGKRTPPPVPTKRSTLSIRKTVTQQLREREREKERERERDKEDKLKDKEREQLKNKRNASKVSLPADEYITTEEVLKQSKYVKTYIKNPDPYFEYDPTVLARLKFEELRDLAGKLPRRKQTATAPQQPPTARTRQAQVEAVNLKPKALAFKKCSKPNYPELANLKIRTGSANDDAAKGDYFNPAEVTKNAKKFDERVKKLQISSDDDLDEIDGPLTKSESSDELNPNTAHASASACATASASDSDDCKAPPSNGDGEPRPAMGTFTNTISSEEFQAYLERKGLTLMPKRELNSATPRSTPTRSSGYHTAEERRQQVADSLAALRKSNTKKLSVLQRLSNSLFPPRRKTTPKLDGSHRGMPHTLYADDGEPRKLATAPLRRIRLEREAVEQQPPLQRSAERQSSMIPRRVSPESGQASRFHRTASMDRNQIRAAAARQPARPEASSYPMATSTPLRSKTLPQQQSKMPQQEWEQLRAIKEVTDRQLYHKVLQQQQQQQQQQQVQQQQENIYEHLQPHQLINPNFVRGSLQRNTFSGISGRNRQVMILDGTPIAPLQHQQPQQQLLLLQQQQPPPRCQSVMDELISRQPSQPVARRGYESETEATPVIMRRKENKDAAHARRIGGLLTRDEILEKVKEFCRKSMQRTPLPPAAKMQPIYEQRHNNNNNNNADISPVSYASVERPPPAATAAVARPQVPQRVQSLPRTSFVSVAGSSPIYAHVNKRNSLLSNDSEPYLSEYVLIQTADGLQAAKLIDYHQQSNLYMQPQLLRAAPQGYVRMEELALAQHQHQQQQQQQQLQQQQQHFQNGRATPLILDRSSQQGSQIYWTPQHQQQQQRLQHLSLPKSRGYPVAAPRYNGNYVLAANGQPYATVIPSPRSHAQQQQQQPQPQPTNRAQLVRNTSDWDCSSEAGEVRRIMEKSL
ncbi:hypothetical protein KR093_002483, partial [Drosophila rubida]